MYQFRFKLAIPTLSFLATPDIPKTPVLISAESPITLVSGNMHADRLVNVEWEGKTLRMFASDLRSRGKSIGVTRANAEAQA